MITNKTVVKIQTAFIEMRWVTVELKMGGFDERAREIVQ